MKIFPSVCRFAILAGCLLPHATHAACIDPVRDVGAVVYNAQHDVFQGCTPGGWIGFHKTGPVPVANGLIAHWRLDEKNGAMAADSSGHGNVAAFGGGPRWVDGMAGGALEADSYGEVLSLSGLSSTAITLAGWMKTNENKNWLNLIWSGGWSHISGSWVIYTAMNGNAAFGISEGGVQRVASSAPGLVLPGVWQHYVGTYNGTQLNLYINGALVAGPITRPGIVLRTANVLTRLGEGSDGGDAYDDLRVYNRGLSAAEVKKLYDSSFCTDPGGHVGAIVYNSAARVFQGCTSRGWIAFHSAGSGGGACTDPTGSPGDVVYNAAWNIFQGCTIDGWMALHQRPRTCVADGLVAYWRLDETAGTTAYDMVGLHNGMLTSPVWLPAGGAVGGALSSGGWFGSGDLSGSLATTGVTVAGWVKTSVNADFLPMIQHAAWPNSAGEWSLYTDANGNVFFGITDSGNQFSVSGNNAVVLDTWQHFSGTYDGTNIKLFVNGVEVATAFHPGIPLSTAGSAMVTSATAAYDDLRIYSRALSAAEIGKLAGACVP